MTSLIYDSYGLPDVMTDSVGSEDLTFNAANSLTNISRIYKKADGTNMAAKAIGYSYYANGSRASMTTPGGNFSYSYDNVGRPTSLTNPQSEVTGWTYLDNSWMNKQTSANGLTATFNYNTLGQVKGLTNRNAVPSIISQFGHDTTATSMLKYDGAGNLSFLKALSTTAAFGGTTNYSYDIKNQLTQEASTRNGAYTNNFACDAAGNPTTFKGVTQTFNADNQQTATGFAYDGNGNPTTTSGGTTLTYDTENRLTAYGVSMTAGYRGDGKRAWKQNSSGRQYFLYDGDAVVCELDGTGAVTNTTTWGANGIISNRAGTTSQFYAWDNFGNVAQVLDSTGAVLDAAHVTAHGVSTTLMSSPNGTAGFIGQWGYRRDNETGLYLLTHRYYDLAKGRFLTRDPISYAGGVNLYSYVGNNPTGWVDPDGLIGRRSGGPRVMDDGGIGGSSGGGYVPPGSGKGFSFRWPQFRWRWGQPPARPAISPNYSTTFQGIGFYGVDAISFSICLIRS